MSPGRGDRNDRPPRACLSPLPGLGSRWGQLLVPTAVAVGHNLSALPGLNKQA
jgi:hypothetical protein